MRLADGTAGGETMTQFSMWRVVLCSALVLLGGWAVPHGASALEFQLVNEFSGGVDPAGTPTVTFTNDGANQVELTIDANLVGTEFLDDLAFNLDPNLNPADLVFTFDDPASDGPAAETITKGVDIFKADGDGKYDIRMTFDNAPPSVRFNGSDTAVYTITCPSCDPGTLTESSFNFLSTPDGGHGPFHVAAHIQGIGDDGDGSGWVSEVPEPGTLALLGSGLVSAGWAMRWRRRIG